MVYYRMATHAGIISHLPIILSCEIRTCTWIYTYSNNNATIIIITRVPILAVLMSSWQQLNMWWLPKCTRMKLTLNLLPQQCTLEFSHASCTTQSSTTGKSTMRLWLFTFTVSREDHQMFAFLSVSYRLEHYTYSESLVQWGEYGSLY